MRGRLGRFNGRVPIGQLLFLALLGIAVFIHLHLCLRGVLLFFLRTLWVGIGAVIFLTFAIACAVWCFFLILILIGAVLILLVVQLVGVIAQLVSISQIRDELPRNARKGGLIVQ